MRVHNLTRERDNARKDADLLRVRLDEALGTIGDLRMLAEQDACEIVRLRYEMEQARLRAIVACNPGINLQDVTRQRREAEYMKGVPRD